MAYETFNRAEKGFSSSLGSAIVTVSKKGRLGLNKDAANIPKKGGLEYVLLLWDKENNKIGIRPIDKKERISYKVSYSRRRVGAGFPAKAFLDYIRFDYSESRPLVASWKPMVLEIEVPRKFLFNESRSERCME